MSNKKEKRGGLREGAGRKPKPELERRVVTVALTKDQWGAIDTERGVKTTNAWCNDELERLANQLLQDQLKKKRGNEEN